VEILTFDEGADPYAAVVERIDGIVIGSVGQSGSPAGENTDRTFEAHHP